MTGDVPLPAPLVPAEVDLAQFPFMPVDVRRLRDSGLMVNVSGDGFMAWMMLVCASWHQKPAASLPDDDKELANLAGFGRSVKEWKRLRDEALYGWIKCADGRFYHAVVAQKALEAWDRRLDHRESENNKTERQRRWRERVKLLSGRLRELGRTPPMNASLEQLEQLVSEAEASFRVDGDASTQSSTTHDVVDGESSTSTSTVDSQHSVSVDAPETAKRETETGTGIRQGEVKALPPSGVVPGQAGDQPGQQTLIPGETDAQTRERRLSEVVRDAIETYNAAPFTKARGGNCPNIQPSNLKARDWVKRAIEQIRAICLQAYGSKTITRQFWIDYWAAVDGDPFSSGRKPGGEEHANWVPDFEFHTRPARIAKMFDLAMSENAA